MQKIVIRNPDGPGWRHGFPFVQGRGYFDRLQTNGELYSQSVSGLRSLSMREIEIVRECLTAAVYGPFFPDEEFATLMGLARAEVESVLATWRDARNPDDHDQAVDNVLNNLLGYPHGEWDAWAHYVSATPEDVAALLARWRGDEAFDDTGRGYFDRLR